VAGRVPRVLIVDLNNFARYPTLAVGYLVAVLRGEGMQVEVFCPLSTGVTGVAREPRTRPWSLVDQQLRYATAVSRSRTVRQIRARLAARHAPRLARESTRVCNDFLAHLDRAAGRIDAVLISTYLMYHGLCEQMCAACATRGIPVLIGGAYFSQPEVVREWISMAGMTALAGGEVELALPEIIQCLLDRGDLTRFPGVWVRGEDGEPRGSFAPPLTNLDDLPIPDFSDFPWDRYPNRIVPIISGRGCAWGACTFCSDVTSTAGRTFRSRSPQRVLEEIAEQSRRYQADMLVFTDLKLNSSLAMWGALLEGMQRAAPGATWIAAIHVGRAPPNGLTRDELLEARHAGMVRLTTGLESGSQRVLDSMAKGTSLEITSQCLRDAHEAGISARATMIIGYPGEDTDDVVLTSRFLREHESCIERVSLNRFQIMTGTRFHRRLERSPHHAPGVTDLTVNHQVAQVGHHYAPTQDRAYRRAVRGLITAVHRINRRELRAGAGAFEGVM
jgi:radical SAM superfamily enzyme YgiQ (UPF0313 family)